MALQLVYTSAPKLIDAGRSGFGVVARSKSLPPLAANAIERFSKYANMRGTDRTRIVMAHRKVTIGSSRFHVLSRIRDSGSDHTGRTNHIAHHLIFSPLEIRRAVAQRLTPADIFAQFPWLDRWEGSPKAFDGSADVQIGNFLPNDSAPRRAAWIAATGDPLHSLLLGWDGAPRSGALIVPAGIELLPLLGEALAQCQNPWEKTFTTSLEPTDELAELDWVIASPSDTSAISRVSSRTVFDISRPLDLPVPTEVPLPKPDVHAAAGREGAFTAQKRVVPPPDLTPRPSQAPVRSTTVRSGSPRQSRETTGGSGNGKLGLIIGGGIAALLLLIATVFVLAQTPKRSETDNLITKIIDQGESEQFAKRMLPKFDEPILSEISFNMGVCMDGLIKLGKDEVAPQISKSQPKVSTKGIDEVDTENSKSQLEVFIEITKNVSPRELEKKSLCHSLWKSVLLIRELNEKPSDSPKTKLADLKQFLETASKANKKKPEWLGDEKIKRIFRNLWEGKYRELVDQVVEGTDEKALKAMVVAWMEARNSTLVTDEDITKLHEEVLDDDERKKYTEKMKDEDSHLFAKFCSPVTEDNEKIAATVPDEDIKTPQPMPVPPAQSVSKLEDEKWCYADFKAAEKGFSISLPESKILKEIGKTEGPKGKFSFGGGELTPFNRFSSKDKLSFKGEKINLSRESGNDDFPSPLKISYKESELLIHFNKWPDDKKTVKVLSGKFTRIPSKGDGKATYTLALEGPGLNDVYSLMVKTISAEVGCTAGEFLSGGKTFEVQGFKPKRDEVEAPSEKVSKAFKEALEDTKSETKSKLASTDHKKGNIEKIKKEIHEKAWKKKGFPKLKGEPLAWLERRYKAEWSLDFLGITRIDGKEMSKNDERGLEILNQRTKKMFEPSIKLQNIEIKAGGHSVYQQEFSIKVEKSK